MRAVDCGVFLFDPMPLAVMLAQFMGIVFGMGWWPCGGCTEIIPAECSACVDDTVPQQFQVDIEDLANDQCDECESLNGTYILDYDDTPEFGGCEWEVDFTAICTDGPDGTLDRIDRLKLYLGAFVSGIGPFSYNMRPEVLFQTSVSLHQDHTHWRRSSIYTEPANAKIDCSATGGPYASITTHLGDGTPSYCDGSGATITVTPL